ncbi:MAG: hypothetical protein ACOCXG_02410 [Nanoarchaeota archaeon]
MDTPRTERRKRRKLQFSQTLIDEKRLTSLEEQIPPYSIIFLDSHRNKSQRNQFCIVRNVEGQILSIENYHDKTSRIDLEKDPAEIITIEPQKVRSYLQRQEDADYKYEDIAEYRPGDLIFIKRLPSQLYTDNLCVDCYSHPSMSLIGIKSLFQYEKHLPLLTLRTNPNTEGEEKKMIENVFNLNGTEFKGHILRYWDNHSYVMPSDEKLPQLKNGYGRVKIPPRCLEILLGKIAVNSP